MPNIVRIIFELSGFIIACTKTFMNFFLVIFIIRKVSIFQVIPTSWTLLVREILFRTIVVRVHVGLTRFLLLTRFVMMLSFAFIKCQVNNFFKIVWRKWPTWFWFFILIMVKYVKFFLIRGWTKPKGSIPIWSLKTILRINTIKMISVISLIVVIWFVAAKIFKFWFFVWWIGMIVSVITYVRFSVPSTRILKPLIQLFKKISLLLISSLSPLVLVLITGWTPISGWIGFILVGKFIIVGKVVVAFSTTCVFPPVVRVILIIGFTIFCTTSTACRVLFEIWIFGVLRLALFLGICRNY